MINYELRTQGAMLASPSTKYGADAEKVMHLLLASKKYLFDLKYDGVRCLAYIEDGKAWLRNRNDVNISHRYPEIVTALEVAFPKGDWVLDGEMLCFGQDGLPTFKLISTRDAQSNTTKIATLARQSPATFMAFDLLCNQGDDIRRLPLLVRAKFLTAAMKGRTNSLLNVSTMSEYGQEMWDFVRANKLEGLIAKDVHGQYRGKRDPGWIKIKPVRRISAIVTGVQAGEGSRAGKIGALVLSLYDENGTLVDIGKVGTGMKGNDLIELEDGIRRHHAAGSLLVVEVEYQELSPDHRLRFPSYRGIRTDVFHPDCTTKQFTQ